MNVFITNTLGRPVFIAGQLVAANMTVECHECEVPTALRSQIERPAAAKPAAPAASQTVAEVLALAVPQIEAHVKTCTSIQLDALKAAELAADTPRRGVIDAIDAALLTLASKKEATK